MRAALPLLLALLVCACGGSPAAPTAAAPAATVRPLGTLSFALCAGSACQYSGTLVNDGPDCAETVRGVTHVFTSGGTELAANGWLLGIPELRPGEQAVYSGFPLPSNGASYHTDVSVTPVRCS